MDMLEEKTLDYLPAILKRGMLNTEGEKRRDLFHNAYTRIDFLTRLFRRWRYPPIRMSASFLLVTSHYQGSDGVVCGRRHRIGNRRMNGKFGGSSCRSGTLRVRTALTYWLYVVSCECELPEFENQSEEYWKLKRVEEVPACR
jgi:hypothetical protein